MSVHVESWAWKQKVGSPLRKLILVKLAQNADDDGISWWRQSKMAEECETTRQTVNTHIAALRGMGLLQVVEQRRDDGGRKGSNYRVLGPWCEPQAARDGDVSDSATGGVKQDDRGGVKQDDSMNCKKNEPSVEKTKTLDALASGAVWLGQRRWKVKSSSGHGRGPYVVNLETQTCGCESGSSSGCVHLSAAEHAEMQMDTARRREFRDALWDALAEIFGQPSKSQESVRGLLATEIGEQMARDGTVRTPEEWGDEVRRRYAALVTAYKGVEFVTARRFAEQWHIGGKLLRGERPTLANADEILKDYE